jgi:hypothetical protein
VAGGFIRRQGERLTLFIAGLLFIVGSVGSGLSDFFVTWLVRRSFTV